MGVLSFVNVSESGNDYRVSRAKISCFKEPPIDSTGRGERTVDGSPSKVREIHRPVLGDHDVRTSELLLFQHVVMSNPHRLHVCHDPIQLLSIVFRIVFTRFHGIPDVLCHEIVQTHTQNFIDHGTVAAS